MEFHLGSHEISDFEGADIVIANPAVPPDNKFLKIAQEHNKFITSQINIFLELCPATVVGITGSNGKSTTTALTAHLLRAGLEQKDCRYSNVWMSGNIGDEPLLAIADKIRPNDIVVLELSSFQIEQFAQIKKAPHVALLTNLTPNHLDRHGTFESYCLAKENIFKYQKTDKTSPALSIFNADDEVGLRWFEKYNKDSGRICVKFSPDDVGSEIRQCFNLPGRAYLSNLAGAMIIAKHFGLKDEQIKQSLPKFKSLPHRLEFIAQRKGASWYNDSKATTPLSAMVALDSFDSPKIIIAGGYDKHIPFDELGEKIAQNTKAVILIGQTAPKIAQAISKYPRNNTKVQIVDSLAKAVETAASCATKGDVVLLSPACASYDMFINFEQRGNDFAELVRGIRD